MPKSQPLVSIVTPAYNEEQHLAECIESVLAQTYENWQYTIVNNCSTDKTLEIARRYAAKDSRIRVHDCTEFLPMLANHNRAIRQISPDSKYCKVVLADDWIFPRCIQAMVEVAEANPSVGLVCAYELRGEEVRIKGLPVDQTFVTGKEACRLFLMEKLYLFGSQNSVMYRADLVRKRNPFYLETEVYADFESCFALLSQSDLGFVHEVLTFSRPRAQSVGAVSSDIGAYPGSVLRLLFSYGNACLNAEEFQKSLELKVSGYYDFLGRRLFVERDPDFWSYHKGTFANLGIQFSRPRLARSAAAQLLGSLVHLKSTSESIRRLFRLRKIRGRQTRRIVAGFEETTLEDRVAQR
jgi:glycosyltransferase involved in cell wall biosynthesis